MRSLPFILAAVLVIGAGPLYAGEHPVPLEKNTDAKKCLECHEDKTKGKSVHSAIQMGCLSCHEIRAEKDLTRVELTAATTQALCLTCHAEKNAAEIKGKVHSPAVSDCVKCHDPHTSGNKNQLLKPTSGENNDQNLCLGCHSIGVDVPKGGSRHAALDMGCETCHVTHKTGERGKHEFDFHLTKSAPALCIDCHDPKDEAVAKAHSGQPIAQASCLGCHDPHQSANSKLALQFRHAVFSDKDSCATCHEAPKDGKVVLNQKDSKALCLTCHEDKGKSIDSAKVQHPGAQGDCTACHTAHASREAKLLSAPAIDVCGACHAQPVRPVMHGPYGQGRCGDCHTSHGGDNPKLLHAQGNGLCRSCHVNGEKDVKVDSANNTVTMPWNRVLSSHEYDAAIKIGLDPNNRTGHPLFGHPISGTSARLKTDLSCLSCHQPHNSTISKLMPEEFKDQLQLCDKCHSGQSK